MDISDFLAGMKKWAEEHDDIKSLVLVGSYARGTAKKDSDVDLVIITTDPDKYLNNSFFDNFGKVLKLQKENWGKVISIRVWYDDKGMEVEFGITSPDWIGKPLDKGTFKVLSDGFKVLADKENYFAGILQNG